MSDESESLPKQNHSHQNLNFKVPWVNVSSSDKMDLKSHESDKISFEMKYFLLVFWLADELVVYGKTNFLSAIFGWILYEGRPCFVEFSYPRTPTGLQNDLERLKGDLLWNHPHNIHEFAIKNN